jgi:putative sugar O-methyltransferase
MREDNLKNWDTIFGSSFFDEIESILKLDDKFENFKQNEIFRIVIGNDVRSKEISDKVYKIIKKQNPDLLKNKSLLDNDLYGGPKIYNYDGLDISPGTLYFIMILSDLKKYFGDLSDKNIIEIGGGYGGQAKIVTDYGCKSYTLIDVEPTIYLARKYLSYLIKM